MRLRVAILLVPFLLLANRSPAGGSGLNVIVVVNQNSTNSVTLGNDYCELRGVPPQNVLRITHWNGGAINWSPVDFDGELRDPLLAMIAARGLGHQAQFVLLSMDIPYRVTDGSNEVSTTSALFYGFKTNTAPVGGFASCSLPDDTSNSYAYSEIPLAQAPPNTAPTSSFLAMMLTDTNLAAAESVLRRAVAADSSFPTQTVYLEKTTDAARNVRFVEFDNAVFENRVAGNDAVQRLNANATTFTNIFGFMTGLATFSLKTNALVAGCVGDSLTSFAGELFENSFQTPLLAFLEAGGSGSYGTVVEPCNYTQKFPDPVDYFYQTRGFSLAEAYYQSVLNPYQGLFAGEPLVAPFARPGTATWPGLINGAVLAGTVALMPVFAAASSNLPLARADLYVDGTFLETLTNLTPTAGNILTAVVNGFPVNYTVPTNAALDVVAKGLAGALNAQSNSIQVLAIPFGDRIELQSLGVFVPGSNVTLSVSAAAGSAPALTTGLMAARSVFLDTVATGYEVVTVNNAPMVGDWIQCSIIKTNGTLVTVGVTNFSAGTTVGTLVQRLVNQINSTASLESADGVLAADFFDSDPYVQEAQFNLYARAPGWPASQLLATVDTATNLQATPTGTHPLADNVSDLRPRNHVYVTAGTNALSVDFPFDTTRISDGNHDLTVVAVEGTSVATQTGITRNVTVQNTALSATLVAVPSGSNAALGQSLQFTVTANATNISTIELFSTGGSLGVATNEAASAFSVSADYLGLGLHPFYALVTDQGGHAFRTASLWYRIIPAITLTVAGSPPVLTWPAIPGSQYNIQSTTNLAAGFETVATLTASNSMLHWTLWPTNPAAFYRLELVP